LGDAGPKQIVNVVDADRPAVLDHEQCRQFVRELGITRSTLYRHLSPSAEQRNSVMSLLNP